MPPTLLCVCGMYVGCGIHVECNHTSHGHEVGRFGHLEREKEKEMSLHHETLFCLLGFVVKKME